MLKRIIIFDDDKDILEVTSVILSKRDYVVKTVGNLRNFMGDILDFHPDVILMDLRIPDIGGKKATIRLKKAKKTQSIPIILFTAQNNGREELKTITGANGILFKPFTIKNLIDKIENVA